MLQKIKINDLQCNFAYLTLSSFQFFFLMEVVFNFVEDNFLFLLKIVLFFIFFKGKED
jgi:ABC-type microcin C transport system permease subunit YejE